MRGGDYVAKHTPGGLGRSWSMATKTASTVANKIRRTRLRAGLTQQQFAKKIGVRQQKLSEWENGKRLRAVLDAMALLKAVGKKA